jgi:hypothetical protein
MLGDQIGELTGRVTGQRILPGDDYRYVKMEVSYQQSGQVYGAQAEDYGTYTVFERVPGQMYGEGQGFTGTADGEGAIWNGHGVGKATGAGMAMSFRFSIAYQAGPTGKLARLKEVLVIGEHEVDASGNTKTRIWEWK